MAHFYKSTSAVPVLQLNNFWARAILILCFGCGLGQAKAQIFGSFDLTSSYDKTNARLKLTTFAYDKFGNEVWSTVDKATMSYSTDGTTFTDFYEYGFLRTSSDFIQTIDANAANHTVTKNLLTIPITLFSASYWLEIYLDLKNPYANIKKIRVTYSYTNINNSTSTHT